MSFLLKLQGQVISNVQSGPNVYIITSGSHITLNEIESRLEANIREPLKDQAGISAVTYPKGVMGELEKQLDKLLKVSASKLQLIQKSQESRLKKQRQISLGGVEAKRELYQQAIACLSIITLLLYLFL